MKRFLLPMAAVALTLASCSTDTKDSYSTINFGEYNLYTDLNNPSEPAQVSSALYRLKLNWTRGCVDITSSDMMVNNQKIEFETDTMAYQPVYLSSGSGSYVEMGCFSKMGNVGKGAKVTDLDAFFTTGVYYVSSLYVPEFETTSGGTGMRLVMGYDLEDRYHVQTLWPLCFYMGKTYASKGTETYGTLNTAYRVELNFVKNTARMAIYYPEFSAADKDVPQAIVIEDVPIVMTHDSYYLQASAPKTRVLGKNDKNEVALIENDQYKVTDFSLYTTSKDLTDVTIDLKVDGYSVNFNGCSIVKANNQ